MVSLTVPEKLEQVKFTEQSDGRSDNFPNALPLQKSVADVMHDVKKQLSGSMLTIVVFGASGHLAKTKTFPAIFELFKLNCLPEHTTIIGYGRTSLSDQQLRERVGQKISTDPMSGDFLEMCLYCRGCYDNVEHFDLLDARIKDIERKNNYPPGSGNRLFYYAIPPSSFGDVSRCVKMGAMSESGWNRMIIEKPFGRDRESAQELQNDIGSHLNENELYRIDHYLAKELIQNIIVLRFANPVLQHVWSRKHISAVKILMKEDVGIEGRGGYYDATGCIRDVIQNHLLQILSLIAMEEPNTLGSEDIRDAKVALLKCIAPLNESDEVIVGQYTKSETLPGYLDDATVPDDSNTETFCQMVLYIDNNRWKGVPFICIAGKGLDERRGEVVLQFRKKTHSPFKNGISNQLVIRIQPNEAIGLQLNVKTPGLFDIRNVVSSQMRLSYKQNFQLSNSLPGAYTRLILDALKGEQELFVRVDELMEAWRVVNDVIGLVGSGKLQIRPYVRGSKGPEAADSILRRHWQHETRYN